MSQLEQILANLLVPNNDVISQVCILIFAHWMIADLSPLTLKNICKAKDKLVFSICIS